MIEDEEKQNPKTNEMIALCVGNLKSISNAINTNYT